MENKPQAEAQAAVDGLYRNIPVASSKQTLALCIKSSQHSQVLGEIAFDLKKVMEKSLIRYGMYIKRLDGQFGHRSFSQLLVHMQ
jgi:hypothetical protein